MSTENRIQSFDHFTTQNIQALFFKRISYRRVDMRIYGNGSVRRDY